MADLGTDHQFKEQAIQNRAYNDANNAWNVVSKETAPTDSSKTNGSLVVSYNAAGDVVKLQKTIAGVTYTKTISNSDETVSTTKTISAWS